jgi:CubicO group peptidase (beta-lactamase class C family)
VHDPTAYILGGISGNAGIFSSSDDLATFMQMMLKKGLYTAEDGSTQRLFLEDTVVLFTSAP